jgi:tetratricopeptide (TPR) repeat protein
MKEAILNKRILTLAGICVLTFICFRYSMHNQFTNWDDDIYVTFDQYIRALSWDNIKTIFTQDITKNNFHPLCMLSLALNYHFSQLQPASYYLTNILIHIANVILVFFLFTKLCKRLKVAEEGTWLIASFGALWFGIHPMHVESVSWIAERKDVLYTFFYVAGLITYVKHAEGGKSKWYWITFLLFIASCLSKPMAVVFPLSLVCIDFLYHGKFTTKTIIQKAPFFAASLLCGGLAVYTQHKTGAIAEFGVITVQERIMYASYGFMMYIYKFFNPTFLSTFYPYPYKYISGWLPAIYYLAPFISIAVLVVPLYFTYKKNREYFKIALFGLGFFVSNVIFVLQLISCGAAIMADRYSYVAYIGLFFMLGYFIYELIRRFPSVKIAVLTVFIVWSGALSYLCYQRTYVWHDARTLLTDAINKYPMRALLSYKWLGNYYMDNGQLDSALINYGVLTELNSADAKVYDQVGNIYRIKGDYKGAFDAYQKSLQVQDNVYKTYLDIAITYACMGDSANTIKNFAIARQLNPEAGTKWADDGFTQIQSKLYSSAIIQYNTLIMFNPNNPYYYFYRGVGYFGLNNMEGAISNWTTALKFNNREVALNAAYNLSVACDSVGNDSAAVRYANMAMNLGCKLDKDYMNKLTGKAAKTKH